jgi:hypothetical protein
MQDGTLKFLPGRGADDQFEATAAPFPPGSRIEYRIQKGDMYFEGDRSQTLGRTLWAVTADGTQKRLASGFVLYISLAVASRNLGNFGIPFRVVSVYGKPNGDKVETEIPLSRSRIGFPAALLVGTSNLWLGVIAGLFVREVQYLVGIGLLAVTLIAITRVYSAASHRAAFLHLVSMLPMYAAGYALAVVLARFAVRT